ncbi:MAG TPA: hypothetical protein VN697_03390 [Tepidiformaceae bacterium]|nr:hypothetical protein [Tepidiformaceae bacterium]
MLAEDTKSPGEHANVSMVHVGFGDVGEQTRPPEPVTEVTVPLPLPQELPVLDRMPLVLN